MSSQCLDVKTAVLQQLFAPYSKLCEKMYNIDKSLIFKDGVELTFGYTVHHTPQT